MSLAKSKLALGGLLSLTSAIQLAYAQEVQELDAIYVTAESQLQQSLGVSHLSREDIDKRPPVNDISELLRTMPGVNLSGNTATGQYGNKRQIDLRGMGPENTLILIDGRPVTSRNSARISMRGERNTRGDSNWVPVEQIESISVLRGPAAARYGSGAMGGVVNIVTKKSTDEWHGSFDVYTNQPQSSKEGDTRRFGFSLSGPIVQDRLGIRLYGNYNKTKPDSLDLNTEASTNSAIYTGPTTIGRGRTATRVLAGETLTRTVSSNPAGYEGVKNQDLSASIDLKINENHSLVFDSSFSRQGNIYNGDSQNSNQMSTTRDVYTDTATGSFLRETTSTLSNVTRAALGMEETSRLYRQSHALTHHGHYSWGDSKTWISYDRTKNSRLPDAMAGGPEGSYNDTNFVDTRLENWRISSEAYIPFKAAGQHTLTVGAEWGYSKLDDPYTISYSNETFGIIEGRNNLASKTSQTEWALFVEDNWAVTNSFNLIPALRFDHNNKSGSNVSGGLNFSWGLGESWLIKGGVARAYKAPNLYQSNPNFLLATNGNGCPILDSSPSNGHCYFVGNADLKPETSWNKEIGVEFNKAGWQASVNYFHNNYRNKITGGEDIIAQTMGTDGIPTWVMQWTNAPKAVISGFEGNLVVPLHDTLTLSNNFTYMAKSEDYKGNPLSLIPKYTINSTLSWQPTDNFDANITFTQYGKIKPREVAINRTELASGLSTTEVGSYNIWGINAGYKVSKNLSLRAGVSNVFNKRLYRTNDGARTFNERGRAYYASMRLSF